MTQKKLTVDNLTNEIIMVFSDPWGQRIATDIIEASRGKIKQALLTFAAQEAEPLVEPLESASNLASSILQVAHKLKIDIGTVKEIYDEIEDALAAHRAKYPRRER